MDTHHCAVVREQYNEDDEGRGEKAVPSLHQARDTLASIGAAPFLERVDTDLTSAGFEPVEVVATASRTAKSPLDLTDRERDVAVLVAKGFTNPEVAEELYVSRKAVEYHLHNIFGKLGITSRRELRGQTLSFSPRRPRAQNLPADPRQLRPRPQGQGQMPPPPGRLPGPGPGPGA